jgi:Ca2+-binding RTX toxin-like protein
VTARRARWWGIAPAAVLAVSAAAGGAFGTGPVARAGSTCGGAPLTITGSEGPDVIQGTSGPDVIHGQGGDDVIDGGGGDDRICGGAGEDRIEGGAGWDSCDGGPDADAAGCESETLIP